MKFMSSRSIIFNADSPVEIASRIYFELPGSLPPIEWFRRAAELTKVCGWLYIPLSEEVEVDLLTLSEVEEKDKSGAIDVTGCASRAEWRGDKLVFPMAPPTIKARYL
jgi:hypothetical protein